MLVEKNASQNCKCGQNTSQFWGKVDKMLVTIICAINTKIAITLHLQNNWLQELKYPFCVIFEFGSAKVFFTATYETYFYYHKDIWITATA